MLSISVPAMIQNVICSDGFSRRFRAGQEITPPYQYLDEDVINIGEGN